MSKLALTVGLWGAGVILTGCVDVTAASSSKPKSLTAVISVSLSPSATTLLASQSVQFTATVQGDSQSAGVTWAISALGQPCPVACGVLSQSGTNQILYSAPTSISVSTTLTLTATSVADSSKSSSAQITLTPPISAPVTSASSVSVSPPSASVQVSQNEYFSAVVQNDVQNAGVNWALLQSGNPCSPGCGGLYPAGLNQTIYFAPTVPPSSASVSLVATSIADKTQSASSQITITSPAPNAISITLAPSWPPLLRLSQSQQVNASVQNDVQNAGVSWSLTQSGNPCAPTCGSFAGSSNRMAIFAAPNITPNPNTLVLTATSLADTSKSTSLPITIAFSGAAETNPAWIDPAKYGLRAFKFPAQTEQCSIVSGSTALACQNPMDWMNGDGIRVDEAGGLTSIPTPTGVWVTPVGILNGSTRYDYEVVAEDYNGALTAASPAGATSTGASILGPNTVNLVGCTHGSNGKTTYTTTVPHSFQVGATVWVSGNTDFFRCSGVMTIESTPTPTTFVSDNYRIVLLPGSGTGGTAAVLAGNIAIWSPSPVLQQAKTIRYWIYRNAKLVGVAAGNDSYYVDYDYGLTSVPSYVSLTAPTTPTPGWLSTVITAGAGTNKLTLANPATSPANNQLSFHDDSPALLAAFSEAVAQGGGQIFIPTTVDALTTYPFTTTLVFPQAVEGGAYVHLLIGGGLTLYETWVLNGGYKIEGQAGGGSLNQGANFGTNNYSIVVGYAHPMMYSVCRGGITLQTLDLQSTQNQEWALLIDGNGSCGSTNIQYTDLFAGGTGQGSVAEVIRGGGFGHNFVRGGLFSGGGGGLAQEALQILSSENQGPGWSLTGIVTLDGTFFSGKGIKIDNTPGGGTAGLANSYTFKNLLFESVAGPFLLARVGPEYCQDWIFQNINTADPTVGFATPMVDLTNSSNVRGIEMDDIVNASSAIPLFAGMSTQNVQASLNNIEATDIGISGNGYTLIGPVPGQGDPQWVSAIPLSLKELAAPQGVTGMDILWGDQTAHTLKFNPNNAGAKTVAATSDIDAVWNATIGGELTTIGTSSIWTPDKPITVTRIQVQVVSAPQSCSNNAMIGLTDGVSPQVLTVMAAANDSGPIIQNYAAGVLLNIGILNPAIGCSTSPAQANVTVQYHVQ